MENKQDHNNKCLLVSNYHNSDVLNKQLYRDKEFTDTELTMTSVSSNLLTAQVIDESRRIVHDPSVSSYSTIQSLREALDQ